MNKFHFRLAALLLSITIGIPLTGGIAFGDDEEKTFPFPTAKDFPKLATSAKTPQSFVPKQWHIVARSQGDLNGDGLPDQALVLRANYPRFLNKNTNLGSDIFDTNPRSLVILFKKSSGGYMLAAQNNFIIGTPDGPTIEDPFQDMSISRTGVLKIDLQMFQSAGSWWMTNYSYKFKSTKNDMVLIGSDVLNTSRASGQYTSTSCNFLSGRKRVDSAEEQQGKVKVTKSKLKRINYRLSDFRHLDDWSELQDKF